MAKHSLQRLLHDIDREEPGNALSAGYQRLRTFLTHHGKRGAFPSDLVTVKGKKVSIEDDGRGRTLLKNLHLILLFLPVGRPKDAAPLLQPSPAARARLIALIFDQVEQRLGIYRPLAAQREEIEDRLARHDFDLSRVELLPRVRSTRRRGGGRRSATPSAGVTLGEVTAVRELERLSLEQETPRSAAASAYHHLRLGSLELARTWSRAADELDPASPYALAVRAFLRVQDSVQARAEWRSLAFTCAEAGPGLGDAAREGLQLQVLDAAGQSGSLAEDALGLFLTALGSWPQEDGYRDWQELWEAVVEEALELASTQDVAQHREPLLLLLREAAQRPGFGIDALLDGPRRDLRALSLYRRLDEAEYRSFGRGWVERLGGYSAHGALSVLSQPRFTEHLHRLAGPDAGRVLDGLVSAIREDQARDLARAEARSAKEGARDALERGRLQEAYAGLAGIVVEGAGLPDEPRLGFVYCRVRVLTDWLARLSSKRRLAGVRELLQREGKRLEADLRQLAGKKWRDYLVEVDDDHDEYQDELGRTPDLLPGDPRPLSEDGDPSEARLPVILAKLASEPRLGAVARRRVRGLLRILDSGTLAGRRVAPRLAR